MRSRLLATVACASLLVAVGLGWPGAALAAAPPQLSVSTSVDPATSFFGDEIMGDVTVDVGASAKAKLRVEPDFSPFAQIGPPKIDRSHGAGGETVHYSYLLQCVSADCLPGKKARKLRFPAVDVSATAGSQVLTARATWAPLFISSRLTPADIARSTPRFRRPAAAPAVTFGVPAVLTGLLFGAGALLALVALGLLVYEARRWLRARRVWALANRTPLEVAIAYTRQAAGRRDSADRRKALGLLARALAEGRQSELAVTTDDAAWGEEPPSPSRALELADKAEAA
jgi:hypothetical protein